MSRPWVFGRSWLHTGAVGNSAPGARSIGDLSHEQVALLVEQFTGQTNRIADITAMLIKYAQAGGKDWETYERLLDHLAREGMKLIQYGRGPLQTDLEKTARVGSSRPPGPPPASAACANTSTNAPPPRPQAATV
jgi:hypothetical protein